VATGVAHHAHGPIVVVHGPVAHDAPLHRIVVGIDGWDESKVALDWACDLAAQTGAAIDVVHGWEYPYRTKDAVFGSPRVEMQQDASALVDRVLAEMSAERRRLVTGTHVVEGSASEVLIDSSKDADLLVVGSRGRGGVRSLLLGSVSRKAMHHALCPVVAVPSSRHPGAQ
jgi:nucleotide-binding universal stress UspA family protein